MTEPAGDDAATPGGLIAAGNTLIKTLAQAASQTWAAGQPMVGTEAVLADLIGWAAPPGVVVRSLQIRARDRLAAAPSIAPRWKSRDGGPATYSRPAWSDISGVLLEATWNARRLARKALEDVAPTWSAAVAAAVQSAADEARHHQVRYAHRLHLLAAILADRQNRATELLSYLGVEPGVFKSRVDESATTTDLPMSLGAMKFNLTGMLKKKSRGAGPWWSLLALRWQYALQGDSMPVVTGVEMEAIRQAVRLDDRQVSPVHLLLAVGAIDEQLRGAQWELSARYAAHCGAAALLRNHGADHLTLLKLAATFPNDAGPVDQSYPWRRLTWDPPVGVDMAAVVDVALAEARSRRHKQAGTDHVLRALLHDNEGPCVQILKAGGTDVAALRRDVLQRLDD